MTEMEFAADSGDKDWVRADNLRVSAEPRMMRVAHGAKLIAQTTRAQRLSESGRNTLLFAPRGDVNMDHLEPSGRVTFSASKGRIRFLTLKIDGLTIEDAAFEIDQPLGDCGKLVDHVCFDQAKIDQITVRPAHS